MKDSQTFANSLTRSGGKKSAVRDDNGCFAPINVGLTSKYAKKESDKDAWYAVADALGLEDADLFVGSCAGFSAKSYEERVNYIKLIVKH